MNEEPTENNPQFVDDGFRIKRKNKNETGESRMKTEGNEKPLQADSDEVQFVKAPDFNIIKVAV